MASFRAHLSRNEETTLSHIAVGTSNPDELREPDIKRLLALGLVTEIDGILTVTKVGLERCQGSMALGTPKPGCNRRLKQRRLPF